MAQMTSFLDHGATARGNFPIREQRHNASRESGKSGPTKTLRTQLCWRTKISRSVDHCYREEVNNHKLDEGLLEDEYAGPQRRWEEMRASRLPVVLTIINFH